MVLFFPSTHHYQQLHLFPPVTSPSLLIAWISPKTSHSCSKAVLQVGPEPASVLAAPGTTLEMQIPGL